jgi:hypothetical protein
MSAKRSGKSQRDPAMPMDQKWEEPVFRGLTLLGEWRTCPAMVMAQERGSVALEEFEVSQKVGCTTDAIEQWLAEYWIEHSIQAVMDGTESAGDRSLSLVRQCRLARPKQVLGDRYTGYFQVRLFSPRAGTEQISSGRRRSTWPGAALDELYKSAAAAWATSDRAFGVGA